MPGIKSYLLLVGFITLLLSCSKNGTTKQPTADTTQVVHPLVPILNEVSGIADSKLHPGNLWVQEDSGNPPKLYLLAQNGNISRSVYLDGAANIDWEDMLLVSDNLYLADIGDNNAVRSSVNIYKFAEPANGVDTIRSFEKISIAYNDGARDAEAILVDPATKDIFIITKRESLSRIYRVAFPYNLTGLNIAQYITTLPYNTVVSAALSPEGTGVIIKTYASLYFYSRPAGTSIPSAFQGTPKVMRYTVEPQGEAVSFAIDGSGYFTLSEKASSSAVNLYYYKTR